MLREVLGKRVLLLQGPNGPFFSRFAEDLRDRGCAVTKVNFNSGDDLFYRGREVIRFRDRMEAWPGFCRSLMQRHNIEAVFMYGDQRPIHRAAHRIAEDLGIAIYVFEEGYLRPDFVTLERGGANANSHLPRDPEFYRRAAREIVEPPAAVPMGNTFRRHGWLTAAHATAFTWFAFRYPDYQHHRDINAYKQAFFWTRAGYRKLRYQERERGLLELITGHDAPPFFLVPLQVYCDAQLQHSRFPTMSHFIEEVMRAFAESGPRDTRLVIKHHPHDRGYTNYGPFITERAREHGLDDRVFYIHDQHLPTLLKKARGVITMNSTVGLSALYHGAPVKVLGDAIYDMPGLTAQQPLAEFLGDPGTVDQELVSAYIRYLRQHNQVNGSFYVRVSGFTRSGLHPAVFGDGHEDDSAVESTRRRRREAAS